MIKVDNALTQYRDGSISWDQFIEACVPFMEQVLHPLRLEDEGEMWDIIGLVYAQMERIVTTYVDRGNSFDGFFATCIRYSAFTYLRQKRTSSITFSSLDSQGPESPYLLVEEEPEISYGGSGIDTEALQAVMKNDDFRRQMIMVFCRNVPVLSITDSLRFAKILNLPEEWVDAVLNFAQHHRRDRNERTSRLRDRRNFHYGKMAKYDRIRHYHDEEYTRIAAEARYKHHRRMWLSNIEQLRRQTCHLTASEISLFLGIPKGTVEGNLHRFARTLATHSAGGISSSDENTSGNEQPA